MFEMIAYLAHAKVPPQSPSLSRAERLLAFPEYPNAVEVEPQTIDELFSALLQQALRSGELSPAVSRSALALLKTIFYGVPLATRREGVHTIRQAYHEALAVLLTGLKHEGGNNTHEEQSEHRTGVD